MKKWIAVLLAALLLMSAGCIHSHTEQNAAADNEPAETETAENTPAEQNTPEPAEPQGEADLSFDTVTVFGDPIDSKNLHEYDLVMVNCWAEWCGPCVGEMPELERIHQEFPNVLLLGVLSFSNSMESAKATIGDTGVTYPVIEPAGTLVNLVNRFDAIPATMFFDSTGKEIAQPVVGSRSYEEWKAIIEDLLP